MTDSSDCGGGDADDDGGCFSQFVPK